MSTISSLVLLTFRERQLSWHLDVSLSTSSKYAVSSRLYVCVCVCVRACVRACVRVCVCVFSSGNGDLQLLFVLSISKEASECLKGVRNDPHWPLLANTITLTHTYTLSVLRLPQQAEPHSVMLYIWVLTLASNMWTTINLLVWIQHLPFPLGYDEPCWCLQIPHTHSHESPWRLFSPWGELSGWGLYPGPRLTLCALAIRDTTSQQGPYERNSPSFFWPCTLLSDRDGQ